MTSAARRFHLPPLPRISDLIRLYGLTAKKSLSQNFILDLNVTDKISKKADVFDCYVCEVGAGPGSLTRSLLNSGVRHVSAVEIDQRFIPSLEILAEAASGYLSVHHENILRCDIAKILPQTEKKEWTSSDPPGIRLVGNLPFNVSIPLLLQWLEAIANRRGVFSLGRIPMSLVFQREVGDNIVADQGSYDQSRLSIMTQNLCEVKQAVDLPSTVFVPQPKVDAVLLNFIPRIRPAIDASFETVEQVVKATFGQRRKMIRTSLKLLFPERESLVRDVLSMSGVTETMRAHQLQLDDFDALCQSFVIVAKDNGLTLTPLRVNKPIPVVSRSIEIVL